MAFCFCFLAGILAMSLVDKKFSFVYLYLSLFIFISFIIIFWRDKKIRFVIFCILFIILGIVRYWLALPDDEIKEGQIRITGDVASEPDVRQDGVRYIVQTQNFASVRGKIYFKYQLYPRFNYGDQLQINCELQMPEAFDDFRYDKYLAARGVFLVCNNPRIEKIGENGGNFVFGNLLKLKNAVANKVSALWQEPYAGFMAGMLYGYRGGLGELNDLFAKTGISHIIAISGYNISIIASVLITIFIYLLIPRKKAFWLVVSGIILFVIFTGASPSVMRSGVIGILVLLARQIGRVSRINNAILLAACFMVLSNPFVLIWDAGFQLSFLATLGLVYLSPLFVIPTDPPMRRRVEGSLSSTSKSAINKTVLKSKVKGFLASLGMTEVLTATLSAIIATLPLILYQFGRLAIVALPVNILVLWIIPFLMLGGFLAVIFSFIFFPLGQVIAWITFVGMKYVVVIVEFFGNLKFAAIDLQIPLWAMVGMYGIMIYFVVRHPRVGGDLKK